MSALLAFFIVTANASFAVYLFLRYFLRPTSPQLPPWEDPGTLDFGLFLLTAPIGAIIACIAGVRGAPKLAILLLLLTSAFLFLLGIMAGIAV